MSTTQDLSTSSITAALAADIEERLTAVRGRIAEIESALPDLRASEALLVRLRETVGTGPAAATALPGPRAATPDDASGAAVEPTNAPAGSSMENSPAPKGRRKAAPAKRTAPGRAARSGAAARTTPRRSAGEPTLPDRVLAYLQGNPGPQKAGEIAAALFGDNPTQAQINRTRTAADALVKRAAIEKPNQGTSVFYQAGESATEAADTAPLVSDQP